MSGKLEQRIQSAHLTRTEKVIADYFLEHSGSLYFLTAKDIALALGVSDTSVIRLCRTLGYRGFRELQESLRSELSQVIEREKYVIPQHQVPDKLQKYQDLSSFQCLQFAVDCLQETYRKNDPEKYGQIVRILLESEHIFVSGFRGLAGPARHLGTLLSQYTRHVEYFCDADTRCVEKLLDYGPHDCVILLGAERYSRMTCVLAEMAHDAGCRLIVITDKLTVCRNEKVCPCCGRICGEHDAFCAVCGTRLSKEEPEEEKAPAAEPEIQPAAADAPAAEPEAEARNKRGGENK